MSHESSGDPPASAPGSGSDRRTHGRVDVAWSVDCRTEDTFLYASIANISAMGIFVRTDEPLPVGTCVRLTFSPSDGEAALALDGVVQWVNPVRALGDNPNPGMGVQFERLTLEDRERLVEAIHTIAYVRED